MINASLKQLSATLAAKKISSVELTQLYLDRIAKLNPALNAYITVNPELSLSQARTADERIAAGRAGVVTGIPIAQKDIFCARGWNIPKLRRYIKPKGQPARPIDKVVYFVDLYANYNDHALGRAVVDVLLHNDIEVALPPQMGSAVPARLRNAGLERPGHLRRRHRFGRCPVRPPHSRYRFCAVSIRQAG